jgi:uncharacterized membrane protein YheB (UPF0754 family)
MHLNQIFTLLLLPILLAGLHGWFTNWLAVKLLLKPVRPINILGFKIQGLLPRRQADLADRISEAISREFLKEEDILGFLKKIDPAKAYSGKVGGKSGRNSRFHAHHQYVCKRGQAGKNPG